VSESRAADLTVRVRRFIAGNVIGEKPAWLGSGSAVDERVRSRLQRKATKAGLLAPHLPPRWGGLGLGYAEQADVFVAAGYSPLGPIALNIAAPDKGNMHLLDVAAIADQQEKFLRPLAAGRIRSAFRNGRWHIDGRKWFIVGADGAAVTIVMARTGVTETEPEATLFLVPAGHPGMRTVRHIQALDSAFVGGHCELAFEDCEAGRGFQHAQVRLAPARLTHCMRWLGVAQRALDIATDHVQQRSAFGARLTEHGPSYVWWTGGSSSAGVWALRRTCRWRSLASLQMPRHIDSTWPDLQTKLKSIQSGRLC
jgi:acyl-CoA dehydrogenase